MAQATTFTSPDFVQQPEDTPMSTSEQPQVSEERKSMFGKLKDKTKTKKNKLKNKLKPGSGGDVVDDSSSSSSSDDEADAPTNNAFSGMTQPEYERKLDAGQVPATINDDDSLFGRSSDKSGGLEAEDFNQRTPAEFPKSHGQDDSALSEQFQGLSTSDKPSSQMNVQSDSTLPSEKFGEDSSLDGGLGSKIDRDSFSEEKPSEGRATDDILSKAGDPSANDLTTEHQKPDPEGLLRGEKSAEPAKSWGQWVGEKVGLAKDTVAAKSPSTTTTSSSTDEKPITEKAYETVLGAKDAVVGKTNEAADTTMDSIHQNKEAAATTDPAKQTYTQKFTGAIYGAKDSLLSSTHPGDDDKALSQKVTETVSNLPGTIKSSLGFGASKASTGGASSPTTTPALGTSSDVPSAAVTDESTGAPAQSPGIVSRITDSVSSLWGKKQPTDTPTTTPAASLDSAPSSGLPTSETAPTTEFDSRAS
ncbi:hypothetical protein MPTK1_1g03150 [Marchantia polymorpha subsp. ruderalis]|uniref:Uncharacterized protein n=2 Tax=Marchantia polymorpha TaxID=3197 RepID=A0AAF6AKZ8_MARPO|nr:hypothetical protein MARPO_0005s0292 [Marchantia polymorpha]BBM97118.1 hypothetical protein Mp_1g03150 [Marchantia polymorpha subsp. ruderalis]|eukprot:PTQ48687.1 hypothetical protein MARPO_0005s0292 [Marchantia polymorpha]